jgi:hypothetical protein
MRAGRTLAAAVVLALAAASLPGALLLVPTSRPLDRATPWSIDTFTAEPVALEAPSVDAVPITPPDDSLAGDLAPVTRSGPAFKGAQPGQPAVYALVVGIDDYPGVSSDLESAVADADTIDQALARFGVPATNRLVLRDGQARKPALVAAIESLVAMGGPESTLVLAYAGHARKLDHDTEAIVAADGGLLRDDELAALLAPARPRGMWLLLAACYAGGFTEPLGPGRILTAAADARSLAYESRTFAGSYLVQHLVREAWLEGRTGPSVQDAFAYADARIAEEGSQGRPVQVDLAGWPFVLGAGGPSPGAPDPGASPPPSGSPAPPPTTTPPERTCTLVVLCRRG